MLAHHIYPPLDRAAARSVPSIITNEPQTLLIAPEKRPQYRLIPLPNSPWLVRRRHWGREPRFTNSHDRQRCGLGNRHWRQRSLPLSSLTWLWMACSFDRLDYRGPSQPLSPKGGSKPPNRPRSVCLQDPPDDAVDMTTIDRHLDKSPTSQVRPGCISG